MFTSNYSTLSNKMRRVILTHFYNEEHLLPWWLNHHTKYFDHGLLINWGSTDRSLEIIKDLAPTWQVIDSKFKKFDAHHLEWEMMNYERQAPTGIWRLSIPTSEFLVGDIDALTPIIPDRHQWIIPTLVFAAYDPNGSLDHSLPLWEQIKTGRHYKDLASHNAWQCRSFHNYNDIFYSGGRHFSNENTDKAMIFKFANVLVGRPMINRKLQIQDRISDFDKEEAVTHTSVDSDRLTEENLLHNQRTLVGEPYDCSELIKKFT